MDELRKQYAALDLVEMNREHAARMRVAIRQRFAAGMLDALDAVPGVSEVYFDFGKQQMTRALRTMEDVQAYLEPDKYAQIKQLSGEDVRVAKAFFKALAPLRKSLGTSREVSQEISSIVPGSFERVHVIPRNMMQALCQQLLVDPGFRLDAKGHATLQAGALDERTPQAASRRASPRF